MAEEMTVVRLADLEPLIEALRFYASESSWERQGLGVKATRDRGEKARKALLKRPQARIIGVETWNPN